MVTINYLEEKLDQIERVMTRLNWVSSYEIFIQNIESLLMKRYDKEILKNDELNRAGASVRIISRNERLLESNFSLSSIPSGEDLSRPKSTMIQIPISQFPELKEPRIKNVPGDQSSTTSLDREGKLKLLKLIDPVVSQFEIPFFDLIYAEKELRIIKNQGSLQLQSQTLRSTYQISAKFQLGNTEYMLSRSLGSRSFEVNYEQVVRGLVDSVNTRIQLQRCHVDPDIPVILHPNIVGKFMANYFYNHTPAKLSKLSKWKPNIQIYDDPTREAGFNSCLFDDEGTLTRSKPIILDGKVVGNISDYHSSDWLTGGNGYRVEWFEPLTRSYKYPIKPAITNLVIEGGTGRGDFFTERSGKVLLIREGQIYLKPNATNVRFILHANETEIWKNGSLKGPADNITIQGTLDRVLSDGRLSGDGIEVIDRYVPGTVYTGWIAVGPNVVQIR